MKRNRLEICWDFPAQVQILPTTQSTNKDKVNIFTLRYVKELRKAKFWETNINKNSS